MNKAILLHSLEDAQHCMAEGWHKDHALYSTYSGVDVYLKEKHDVHCQCLIQFLSIEDIKKFIKIGQDRVDNIVRALDKRNAEMINAQMGLSMEYFTPMYSYIPKHQYTNYLGLEKSLKKIVTQNNIVELKLYNSMYKGNMSTRVNFEYIIRIFVKEVNVKVVSRESQPSVKEFSVNRTEKILKRFLFRPKNILETFKKLFELCIGFCRLTKGKRVIVLQRATHDISFLKKGCSQDYNVLNLGFNDSVPLWWRWKSRAFKNLRIKQEDLDFNVEITNEIDQLILEDIKFDFMGKINSYLQFIKALDQIHQKHSICLGIWGYPPNLNLGTLIFEYLSKKNIPVFGAQHGSQYGESVVPYHYDCDFRYCTHYFSYGFTGEDLKRVYPDKPTDISVIPVGRYQAQLNNKRKKEIDLLFPLTHCSAMTIECGLRMPVDRITARQIQLLKYLDSVTDKTIYVKLFPNASYQDHSVMTILKNLKNIKVIDFIGLNEFLEEYSPRGVLIEFPSSPLYEVMHLDTEIFLMNDELLPYEQQALTELKKRVYYSEIEEEMLVLLEKFFAKELPAKRDQQFYSHYVYKQGREERVLDSLNHHMNCR